MAQQAPPSAQLNADYGIGCQVKLLTTANEEVGGKLFAFDRGLGFVTLRQPGTSTFHADLRLIKEDAIVKTLHSVPPPETASLDLPVVDEQRSRVREERAVRAAQLEAAKIGVDVTKEAQQIFDALSKTLPCRWEGKSIVVLEEINIAHPYGTEDCSSHADDLPAMERVKKVLLAERNKLYGDT